MTEQEIKDWKDKIDKMSHLQLASFHRFAPSEHVVIQTPELWDHFSKRFKDEGGMTPAVSKSVGWDKPKV